MVGVGGSSPLAPTSGSLANTLGVYVGEDFDKTDVERVL